MSSSNQADSNPQAGQGRSLPKKEADLFRNVVKHYECKQYKKAMKGTDMILKRFPNHGETLAMKGLICNSWQGKRDEAHAFVKQGLTNDVRSHVCWHVYGLLHRSDRNYSEAIKAYKQALRIDPENLQILRDLSLLQIQMRDLQGFCLTRNSLLTLKPNAKINWLSLALAKHLIGDLRGAIHVMDIYLSTLTEGSPELNRGFESSELAMYRNSILAELPQDNFQEALAHLTECESVVVDRGAWFLARATYQLKRGDFAEAKETCLSIFARGVTEDYCVHTIYMCATLQLNDNNNNPITSGSTSSNNKTLCQEALKLHGTRTLATMVPLTLSQKQLLRDAYEKDLALRYPSSPAIRAIPMTLMEGDELRAALDGYCQQWLTKGVPSLCSELSAFFLLERNGRYTLARDPLDIRRHPVYKMVTELADGYIVSLQQSEKFDSVENGDSDSADNNSSNNDSIHESPSTLLWAWYLRAGLHELAGQYREGIALLDQCLDHTPTAVDVYELKARLLKAAGNVHAAVDCLDKGRDLDKQDRYINNQTTKYMLQAGMEEKALARISLFTRHEGNAEQNLFDMQCSWYELELAECLERKQCFGRSLKKFYAVVQHFEDFHEDQFDFHAYCVRKVTLRAYVDVLRFEDELLGEPFYGRAAAGIIRIYLRLYDQPPQADKDEEPDYSNMSAAEKKKAKALARKKKKVAEKKAAEEAERRKREEEAAAAASSNANNNTATATTASSGTAAENGTNKKKAASRPSTVVVTDADPEGQEFLKRDALMEASKFSSLLARYAPKRFETWMFQYDVAIRRKKGLLALQALFKAKSLDPNHPDLFTRIVDFAMQVDRLCVPELPLSVRQVLTEETQRLLGRDSVQDFVVQASATIAQDASSSLPLRVAVAKALRLTNTGSVEDASALIVSQGLDICGVSVEACQLALETLQEFGSANDDNNEHNHSKVVAQFQSLVAERFPMLLSSSSSSSSSSSPTAAANDENGV